MQYQFVSHDECKLCSAPSDSFKFLGRRLNGSQGKKPRRLRGITTSIVRCESCGLIFSDPMPIPLNIDDHYGDNPDAYWTEDHFRTDEQFFTGQIATYKKFVDAEQKRKVLDIGAGAGEKLESLLASGFDAYGIEPGPRFRDHAIAKRGIPAQRIELETIESAKFEDESFDWIIFNAVLEHVYDPDAALKKTMKWLRPSGLLYVGVPNADSLLARTLNLYFRMIGTSFVTNTSPMHVPYHLYEFTEQSFLRHGAKNGYALVASKYYSYEKVFPGPVQPVYRWLSERTKTGLQLEVWLRKGLES